MSTPNTTKNVTVKRLNLLCEDGYTLSAKLYNTHQPTFANIIIASATGVPQGFYRRFAEHAVDLGFQVLTFDYRGIGESAPRQLKGFKMSYLDWGHYDLTAAIQYFSKDQRDLYLLGHSYGGQALGLSPLHTKVKAMYCFGTGAGWHGYMPLKDRINVQMMWNIVFPPLVAAFGYLPWSKLNMGADLPRDVYVQWRKWCKHPSYFFADPNLKYLHTQYAQVKTAIFAVAALDDGWALPASRHAFMQHYKNATVQYIDLTAQHYGLSSIGHMGYFKSNAKPLWNEILHHLLELSDLNHQDSKLCSSVS